MDAPAKTLSRWQIAIFWFFAIGGWPLWGQQPFLVDDADVTERHHVTVEFLNEYDTLQTSLRPNVQQNTARAAIMFGLTDRIEIGLDGPLILISRDASSPLGNAFGVGDLNFQFKCKLVEERAGSRRPALTVAAYTEIPTGNAQQELGSGRTDIWLNTILQKSVTTRATVHFNAGVVFRGNTLTGTVGIRNPSGQVYSLGSSLTYELKKRFIVGGEMIAAIASQLPLDQGQVQAQLGGKYRVSKVVWFDFAITGGWYQASPRLGGAWGVSFEF